MDLFDAFEKRYRAVNGAESVKVYNEKSYVEVDKAVAFDAEKEEFTALDLLVSAVLSEIVLSMRFVAKRDHIVLQDLEAKAVLILGNPLRLLGVRGYEEAARIRNISVTVYYFSFLDSEERIYFEEKVLERAVVSNSLGERVSVEFHPVL
ncbi:Uncharacterised protein [Aedoeadaptatus ivorii]|uniref:Uncharacterized protein n=1 Tax=Aedoeadaptatus ivorii TaxID=54006 RepID=A0A448V2W0_9FIRM|nr:OsmC family peroxiredoxin [Peptoniphilus ivorii]MDQ0508745.1 hypothetical protein [Peptoniphilus ivorii]VEJ36128.1 Uncharacterised protein [Peptoniphilus ivorii]